jgi:hypothetical protein
MAVKKVMERHGLSQRHACISLGNPLFLCAVLVLAILEAAFAKLFIGWTSLSGDFEAGGYFAHAEAAKREASTNRSDLHHGHNQLIGRLAAITNQILLCARRADSCRKLQVGYRRQFNSEVHNCILSLTGSPFRLTVS